MTALLVAMYGMVGLVIAAGGVASLTRPMPARRRGGGWDRDRWPTRESVLALVVGGASIGIALDVAVEGITSAVRVGLQLLSTLALVGFFMSRGIRGRPGT